MTLLSPENTFMLVVSACLVAVEARAHVKPSLEQSVSGKVAWAVQSYGITNHGNWPTNWDQLAPKLQDCNDWLGANGKGRVQALYVFVPTNFPALERPEGRIIASRYQPLMEGGLKGRYVVYQDPDQRIDSCWVSEYEFNEMLSTFGSSLPLPSELDDSLGARLGRLAPVAIMLFVALFSVIGFRTLLRRRSGSQGKDQPSAP